MSKVIAGSLVLVLAVGSAAFGEVPGPFQDQTTLIHAGQVVNLLQGSQLGLSMQDLSVNNTQDLDGAYQGLLASIGQNIIGHGECASVAMGQVLDIDGYQQQYPADGYGLPIEAQSLGLESCQTMLRAIGAGGAGGVHVFDLTAEQAASGFNETSSVGGLQKGNMFGAAGSTAQADTRMAVITVQSQGI